MNATAPKYRHQLPQLAGGLFLTDGGLETTLIFHEGWQLPLFEAFVLHDSERGWAALRAYFDRYASMAVRRGVGFILESATWRANPDWAAKAGYDRARLRTVNQAAIELLREVRAAHETPTSPMPISGAIGPRGDGYRPDSLMTAREAEAYHGWQIGVFAEAGADLVSAFTMTNSPEGLGIANAAAKADMPCVLSFTLETDGRLPSGESLADVIPAIDSDAVRKPLYYMINCAHPSHFDSTLREHGAWTGRIGGVRANASRRSHAELDEATELDAGNPEELGAQYAELIRQFPGIRVLGGCCGTDHRHVESIGGACIGPTSRPAA